MLKKSIFFTVMISAVTLVGFGAFFVQAANEGQPKTQTEVRQPSSEQDEARPVEEVKEVDIKKISQAFGHFIGRNLNNPGMQFDLESMITGIREGASGKAAPMSDQEYEAMMVKLQEKAFSKISEENIKAANAFLDKNAKESQVIVIEPGKLQYLVLEEGKGAVVSEHASPQIEYTGKYIDGTVFGSSKEAGGPITIPLDQTIPGFSKGILGMKEGEKRRLFIHPDLGYGTSGHLPPNSLLIFDIYLIKAQAPVSPSAAVDEEEFDDLLPLSIEQEGADTEEMPLESQEETKKRALNSVKGSQALNFSCEKEEVKLSKKEAEEEEEESFEQETSTAALKSDSEKEDAKLFSKKEAEKEELKLLAKKEAEKEELKLLAKKEAEKEELKLLAKKEAEKEDAKLFSKKEAEKEELKLLAKKEAEKEELSI